MSFLKIFNNQLSKVIRWENSNPGILWYKYPHKHDEIINASKLIVAPGQGCLLVYEGQIADIIENEGIFNLETGNHPFITTLSNINWRFIFIAKLKHSISLGEHPLRLNLLTTSIKSRWNWV